MSTVTITLTPEQANALIEMADLGVEERVYNIHAETGVSLAAPDDQFTADILEAFTPLFDGDIVDDVHGYGRDDFQAMREVRAATIEAFHIINAALGRFTQEVTQ